MAVVATGEGEFRDAVENTLVILKLKQTDWGIQEFFNEDREVLISLPCICVDFDRFLPDRRSRDWAYWDIILNVIYYHSEMDVNFQKQLVDQRMAEISKWLLKNPQVNGCCARSWIEGGEFFTKVKENRGVAGGSIEFALKMSTVDITPV